MATILNFTRHNTFSTKALELLVVNVSFYLYLTSCRYFYLMERRDLEGRERQK